jgi:hypothetical protein
MNPIKADKIQFGSLASHPNIQRDTTSSLVFYDTSVGSISLKALVGERAVDDVVSVSKSNQGADFNSVQEAIDFLPQSGGVVVVYQGTYSESLSISKPVVMFSRGEVVIDSTDAPCITLSDASLKGYNLSLVIRDLVGNNNPSIIEVTAQDTTQSIELVGCSLDTTDHPDSSFLSSSKVSVLASGCSFSGQGSISVSEASHLEVVGARAPDITLVDMISQSFVSVSSVLDVALTNSNLYLSGNANTCVGDVGSTLKQSVVSGSSDFDNEAEKEISLPCPLVGAEYTISVQPSSQGVMPSISNQTNQGFTLTYGNPIDETIRWSALS